MSEPSGTNGNQKELAQGGAEACEAAKRYGEELRRRADREAQTLAALTSWPIDEIRTKMRADYGDLPGEPLPWWRRLWGG